MAKSFNSVTIMGNLTRDPELRTTPNGQSVCNISLALNRSYKVKDEWQEATDYIDVIVWGKQGENVSGYLSKGSSVLIQGRLQNRTWEQDGQKRSKVEVVANDVIFTGGKAEAPQSGYEKAKAVAQSLKKDEPIAEISDEPIDMSEIPF